jgi:protein TonB
MDTSPSTVRRARGSPSSQANSPARSGTPANGSGRIDEGPAGTPARMDPFEAVLALDKGRARIGFVVACAVALLMHGAVSVRALSALYDMMRAVHAIRASAHEFFWSHYDVEVERTPPKENPEPPPEPPPPEPPPDKDAAPKPIAKNDPYDAPPPPSQASKILTRAASPDDPVDQTDRGIVSGDGQGPAYGYQSESGKGATPTMSPHAAIGGKPGGTGTGPPPPPAAPTVDRSQAAGLSGNNDWGSSCPFPAEADVDQIDRAVVTLIVTVRVDGTPQSVQVVRDPGHGFGRAARLCALSHRFSPGLDKSGAPTVATTPPFNVRFTR